MSDNINFIKRANEIHGDKYDYSKTEYINNKTKVCIICPEHGEFWQRPDVHLKGSGCKKCVQKKLSNSDIFVENAKKVHGDKYDYSKVEYKTTDIKVCIICPEHGEFWQTPYNHLKGQGCKKCANKILSKKKATTIQEFILKAREVHGDKYDYSKVEYINNHTKICIICPEHGEFWQTPYNHLRGFGCLKCSVRNYYSNEEYIESIKLMHGDEFIYNKVSFSGMNNKICVICPKHGEFFPMARNFLKGSKCPKCISQKRKYSQSDFILKAREVHGDKYDYSKVEYKDSKTKVYIICPKHGGFWQKPYDHLRGRGCTLCKESSLEKEIRCFLEKNKINFLYQYKMPWLGKQSLDFYLPDYNVAIECQGEQHYNPIDFSNSKNNQKANKKLLYTQKLDKRKKDKCLKNHCNLIYYTKEEFANNGEFYSIEKIKEYLDGIASIDDGTIIREFIKENNIEEWKPQE